MSKNDEKGLEKVIQEVKLDIAERVLLAMVEETVQILNLKFK